LITTKLKPRTMMSKDHDMEKSRATSQYRFPHKFTTWQFKAKLQNARPSHHKIHRFSKRAMTQTAWILYRAAKVDHDVTQSSPRKKHRPNPREFRRRGIHTRKVRLASPIPPYPTVYITNISPFPASIQDSQAKKGERITLLRKKVC
jgi:hypothetical protein